MARTCNQQIFVVKLTGLIHILSIKYKDLLLYLEIYTYIQGRHKVELHYKYTICKQRQKPLT